MQTIKFGKLRASNDPDRSEINPGFHIGSNFRTELINHENIRRLRNTRGSFIKAGK